MGKSTFRKLQDDYEYVVGGKYVRIRNKEQKYNKLVPKEEIGIEFKKDYIVTPGMVWDYIKDGKIQDVSSYFRACSCENVSKRLCYDPFKAEIRDKLELRVLCESCIHASMMEI